jgi:hypothetical protein
MFDPSHSIYIFYANNINNMLILVYDKEQIPGQSYLMSVRKTLSRDPWPHILTQSAKHMIATNRDPKSFSGTYIYIENTYNIAQMFDPFLSIHVLYANNIYNMLILTHSHPISNTYDRN